MATRLKCFSLHDDGKIEITVGCIAIHKLALREDFPPAEPVYGFAMRNFADLFPAVPGTSDMFWTMVVAKSDGEIDRLRKIVSVANDFAIAVLRLMDQGLDKGAAIHRAAVTHKQQFQHYEQVFTRGGESDPEAGAVADRAEFEERAQAIVEREGCDEREAFAKVFAELGHERVLPAVRRMLEQEAA